MHALHGQSKAKSHDTEAAPAGRRIRSELGVVAAHLAPDLHLRYAEDDVAVGVRHGAQLDHPAEEADLPGHPGGGVERHRAGLHVPDQLRQLVAEAAGQHRHHELHVAVAPAGDAPGIDAGDAHQDAPVPELGAPGLVREGRPVRVVHAHGEEHGEVELELGPRREAEDPGGDEPSGGVPDAEHREEED